MTIRGASSSSWKTYTGGWRYDPDNDPILHREAEEVYYYFEKKKKTRESFVEPGKKSVRFTKFVFPTA